MTTPTRADFPARPALDAAARQVGFVPTTNRALRASHKARNTWLGSKEAMNTALDVESQGSAHAVEEVHA
jgi:hypothetical protein